MHARRLWKLLRIQIGMTTSSLGLEVIVHVERGKEMLLLQLLVVLGKMMLCFL